MAPDYVARNRLGLITLVGGLSAMAGVAAAQEAAQPPKPETEAQPAVTLDEYKAAKAKTE